MGAAKLKEKENGIIECEECGLDFEISGVYEKDGEQLFECPDCFKTHNLDEVELKSQADRYKVVSDIKVENSPTIDCGGHSHWEIEAFDNLREAIIFAKDKDHKAHMKVWDNEIKKIVYYIGSKPSSRAH